jgi:hypothetical protein
VGWVNTVSEYPSSSMLVENKNYNGGNLMSKYSVCSALLELVGQKIRPTRAEWLKSDIMSKINESFCRL